MHTVRLMSHLKFFRNRLAPFVAAWGIFFVAMPVSADPGKVKTIDSKYDQRVTDTRARREQESKKRAAARACPNGVFLVSKGSKWNPKIEGFDQSQWRINGAYLRDAKAFVQGKRAGRKIPLLFDRTAESSRGRDCFYKPSEHEGRKAVVLSSTES